MCITICKHNEQLLHIGLIIVRQSFVFCFYFASEGVRNIVMVVCLFVCLSVCLSVCPSVHSLISTRKLSSIKDQGQTDCVLGSKGYRVKGGAV